MYTNRPTFDYSLTAPMTFKELQTHTYSENMQDVWLDGDLLPLSTRPDDARQAQANYVAGDHAIIPPRVQTDLTDEGEKNIRHTIATFHQAGNFLHKQQTSTLTPSHTHPNTSYVHTR